jgi:hypothetical protein
MAEQGATFSQTGQVAMGVGPDGKTYALASDSSGTLATPSAASTARLVSAANSDNATVVKNTAGKVYLIQGLNAAAATRWLKLYNKATTPASTDVPVKTFALQASVPFTFNLGGYAFSNGIGYRIVTGSADNDNTAVTAGDILGLNIDYT